MVGIAVQEIIPRKCTVRIVLISSRLRTKHGHIVHGGLPILKVAGFTVGQVSTNYNLVEKVPFVTITKRADAIVQYPPERIIETVVGSLLPRAQSPQRLGTRLVVGIVIKVRPLTTTPVDGFHTKANRQYGLPVLLLQHAYAPTPTGRPDAKASGLL